MLKLVSKDDTLIQIGYRNKVKGKQLDRDEFDNNKKISNGTIKLDKRHIFRFLSFDIFWKYAQFTISF